MKDFKSFSDENSDNGKSSYSGANGGNNADFANDKNVNMVKNIAASMKGKSEGDILNAIMAEAEKGKRNGTLTNADLDNFYNMIAPTLDGFKRQKLKNIIIRLKRL